jgi:hypothetical protein
VLIITSVLSISTFFSPKPKPRRPHHGAGNVLRQQTALVHQSQGVRHRAEGCMALMWW